MCLIGNTPNQKSIKHSWDHMTKKLIIYFIDTVSIRVIYIVYELSPLWGEMTIACTFSWLLLHVLHISSDLISARYNLVFPSHKKNPTLDKFILLYFAALFEPRWQTVRPGESVTTGRCVLGNKRKRRGVMKCMFF